MNEVTLKTTNDIGRLLEYFVGVTMESIDFGGSNVIRLTDQSGKKWAVVVQEDV